MNTVVDQFASLAGTYRLLSRLWIREVDEVLLESLLLPPLSDVFTAAGGTLPENAAPTTLEALSVDYCQLLLGPANHLPPFQSVWQHGRFQGDSIQSMHDYVSASGCETGELMLDHLGVQLDVMGRLLGFASESIGQADEVSDLAATYFAKHLTWTSPLFDLAIKRASTDFYRSTIGMTRDFLDSEKAFWGIASPG